MYIIPYFFNNFYYILLKMYIFYHKFRKNKRLKHNCSSRYINSFKVFSFS
nr:MAG TPA: hypothetical protein [Caudoviricetes sp.]